MREDPAPRCFAIVEIRINIEVEDLRSDGMLP
jgi:hypothetical protein